MKLRLAVIATLTIFISSACTSTFSVNKISYLINQEISEFEKQLTTNTNITPFTTTKANYLEKNNHYCQYYSQLKTSNTPIPKTTKDQQTLDTKLSTIANQRKFKVQQHLTHQNNNWWTFTATHQNGLTLNIRIKNHTELQITAPTNSPKCSIKELGKRTITMLNQTQYLTLFEDMRTTLTKEFHTEPWKQIWPATSNGTLWWAPTWNTVTDLSEGSPQHAKHLLAVVNQVLIRHGFDAALGFAFPVGGWCLIKSEDHHGGHFEFRSKGFSELTLYWK